MTALTAERSTPWQQNAEYGDPVAAGVKIYQGALVVLDSSGNAKPGVTATGLTARGAAMDTVDNTTGNAGDQTVRTRRGLLRLTNAGDITRANIGANAYIVDDQTVSSSSASSTRSVAGVIKQVDTAGVWILVG